jgi:cob(I)alamin adenosyltransferase
MDNRGYVHVYTGDGKGKTTAALGLTLRAAGAGWKVFMAQFLKGTASSELVALKLLGHSVVVRQYGRSCLIDHEPVQADYDCATEGLFECKRAIMSEAYQLVILDEANVAVAFDLLHVEDIIELIDCKPPEVELVITGRWAHPRIIERADLVTEMLEIKHYYQQGVLARTGVES